MKFDDDPNTSDPNCSIESKESDGHIVTRKSPLQNLAIGIFLSIVGSSTDYR